MTVIKDPASMNDPHNHHDSQDPTNSSSASAKEENRDVPRHPGIPQTQPISSRGVHLPQDVQAKMRAFQLSRQGVPSSHAHSSSNEAATASQLSPNSFSAAQSVDETRQQSERVSGVTDFAVPAPAQIVDVKTQKPRPASANLKNTGLAAKRGLKLGMKLSEAGVSSSLPKDQSHTSTHALNLDTAPNAHEPESLFKKYADYVDTKSGTLNFKGKATVHGKGIDFTGGSSFTISLDEVDTLDELGKGNYGTVYKVRHSKPHVRRVGQGLSGNRSRPLETAPHVRTTGVESGDLPQPCDTSSSTGTILAMKEIRLELDDAKFAAIIMELDILHRCISPFIIEFFGAFFQEGAVYICMEFMDGGSIDKLYAGGVPETVLRKITLATVMGLKFLKEEHNIIHRDVKPTNILINTAGQVKICDFGVSGNLVASIAKTNIGCQSYMAPERISGGGIAQAGANPGGSTYSVQSDIWSLGLTIIECGMGQYPYPPETYDNIFSQLSAIVDGEPPDLPEKDFSEVARDFVRGALNKIPKLRPTYAMLLRHAWLAPLMKPATIMEEDEEGNEENEQHDSRPNVFDADISTWVHSAMERKRTASKNDYQKAPALHTAPLSPA